MQRHEFEKLAQANGVLTRSNMAVMEQSAHMTVTMNSMQAQLNTLAAALTNQTRRKRKCYRWICGSNYTHGSKTCSSNKSGHQYEVYYNQILGESEKVCGWRLGAAMNKIEMIKPKISLINCIDTPHNTPSNKMPAIADSGANIHLEKNPPLKFPL